MRAEFLPTVFLPMLLAGSGLVGQVPPQAATGPAWAAQVEVAIRAQIDRDHIPGLTCAVGIGGDIAYVRGFGLSDVENNTPAGAATVYRLASISKPITAVCAMQLYEAGKLDLDRSVHEIVSAWPEKPWPVTTRQLLGHLGGIRHYRPGEVETSFHYATQTEALSRFAADPLLQEPGTAYHYSTFGFNLVGAVVEQICGEPLPKIVHDRVAVPCGAVTLQDDDVRRIIAGRAQGYIFVDGKLQNSELMDSSYKLGGGGLCCSAPDLVRFAQALLAGRLVKPETLAMMLLPQRLKNGEVSEYGLGFRLAERAGRRVVQHGGAQSRVSTMLYMLPDLNVEIVLLCNLEKVRLLPLAQQIGDLVVATVTKAGTK